MMAYINRAIEDTLKNRFETAKSVAITGARQVGKTTMTKHIYSDIICSSFSYCLVFLIIDGYLNLPYR